VAALAVVCLSLLATPVSASAAPGSYYRTTVEEALHILQAGGDPAVTAQHALEALRSGVGDTQPEIEEDLISTPPRLADARVRLEALDEALSSPPRVEHPARAHRSLTAILAQSRYAGLRPSPWDRLRDYVGNLLNRLLSRIGPAVSGSSTWVRWAIVAAAALLVVLAALWLSVSLWRRPRRRAAARQAAAARRSADRFAEADRLEQAGDWAGAVRALAGAVAVQLGDESDWDLSPLTVRELFARASEPSRLRPLLWAFEVCFYGRRQPSAESYHEARAAAAPYRRQAPA
jgi:hypothetical protein